MHDDRPEREKYRRASIGELLGNELRAFLGSTPLVVLVAVIVGGWLILQLTEPKVIRVTDVRTGDCLYVRAADADPQGATGRPIGSDGAVITALFEHSAERASCEASHSHEVADAWILADAQGAAYPGQGVLSDRELARCQAAFERYVGRAEDGSTLALTVGIPTPPAWDAGVRNAVCLVSNRDGSFLDHLVEGSAR